MKKKEKYKEIEPLDEPTDGEEKDKNPMPKPPPIK